MKIFNGTPHKINIYSQSDCEYSVNHRKWLTSNNIEPFLTIEPSGTLLNCKTSNSPTPNIDCPFPIVGAVIFTEYDPLPDGYDLYIVSNLYRSAVQTLGGDTSRLATVTDTVYDFNSIKPCGCLSLAVG